MSYNIRNLRHLAGRRTEICIHRPRGRVSVGKQHDPRDTHIKGFIKVRLVYLVTPVTH